jgi:hypothetical protein
MDNIKAYIRLDKQIPCDYICKSVQDLVNKFHKTTNSQDTSNTLLILEIKNIEYENNNLMYRLEHKK